MPTIAPKPDVTFTVAPAGTHVARIFKFMNLGTRYQEFEGKKKDYPDCLVNISFELCNEINEFTYEDKETHEEVQVKKPFAVSREFTLSMGKKSNLRPIVEGIIGTSLSDDEAYAFDLESLVGMACLVNVVHKEAKDGSRTYANITSTAPLLKGMDAPEMHNQAKVVDVKTISQEDFEALPDWLKQKMDVSDEFKKRYRDGKLVDWSEVIEESGKKLDKFTSGSTTPAPVEYPADEINPEDIPF